MAKANNPSTAHIVITMAGQQAINYMSTLAKKAEETRAELEKMKAAGQVDTTEYKMAVQELKKMDRAVQQNKSAYIDLNETVNNLSKHSLGYLQKALAETRKRMKALNPKEVAERHGDYNKELAKLASQYRTLDNYIGSLTGQWKRQDGAIMSVIKRLSAYVSVYGAFNLAKNQLSRVFTSNLEFSDQLADIRKTTGLSTQAVEELSASINKIDTRSSVQELHNLAYEAGRLGIGAQGAEAVLGFVRAADKLNVALKEDLGEDAIIQLTKMADVMGLTKKLGVEKSLLSIGSAINELAQNSTASGDFLTNYASRLSGIASQAHMTVDELLGLAAASDATGQEIEVSATAMNKFVVQLQTHYKTVAAAAGINEDALHKMLTMGKTTEAVVTVLEALSKKGGLSMLAPLMEDLGSNGSRLTASLATLATNIDLVKSQLEISKEAFEENISVTNEFNIRNETAAAIMERMKNSWDKMFTNSQNVGVVRDMVKELYELSNSLQQNSVFLGTVNAALTLLVFTIKTLLQMAPYLAAFFSMKGLVLLASNIKANIIPALRNLGMAFSGAGASATGAASATARFGAALRGVTTLMKSNVIIFFASMIASVVYQIVKVSKELTLAEKNLQSFEAGVKDFQKTSHAAGIEVNILFNRLKDAEKGSKEQKKLMAQINEQYGKYLPNLLTEQSSLEEIAKAQEKVNEKLRQALALKAKNQAIDEAGQMFTPKMAEATSRLQEIYTGAKIGGVGENDVQFLIKRTQQLYDAGEEYADIKDKVFKELYHTDWQSGIMGRSATLMQAKRAGGSDDQGLLRNQMQDVKAAVDKYITNFWNQNKAIERASKTYDKLIGDYVEKYESGAPYTIVEAEDDKKKRSALKKAKDEYQAVMAAIEVFYKQQEQVVNEAYLKKEITITQREQRLADIEDRFRRSRIAADEALLNRPGAISKWNQELQRMEKENISQTEDTTQALDNLWEKNLKSIGDRLRKFGDGEMDGIWKNLEKDKIKIQEQAIELQKEIEKILTQNDFMKKVTTQYMEAMQKLGIFFPNLMDDMQQSAEDTMAGLYEIYPKLFDIDIDTNEGLNQFRQLVLNAKDSSVAMATMGEEQMRLLYFKALEYGDAMTEAQKKTRDRNQKIADEIWRATGGEKREQGFERQGKAIDTFTGQLGQIGLSSEAIANDAEIKLYEERVKAASEYRDLVVQMGGDVLSAEQKLNESIDELSAALVDKTLRHLETLKSFVDPVEDFGTKLGEAFAMDDAIERQEAFADALKNLVGDVGEATKKMIIEWVKQKIQHSITRKAMAKAEKQSQKEMTGAVEEGQEAETALMQVGGAIQQELTNKIGAQVVQAKKAQAVENVTTQASETTADAALGIAGGAAKTIGQLGWWGIPLVAVISAVIGGLLSAAMSKVGSLFGGAKTPAATAPTKLVTGMLTYDNGNVQSVLGNDGHVYSARMGGINGSGLVTSPVLTNVNGQAALVGEQGPEIVIGRATTRALMQNNPGLLAGLVSFDKMYSGRGFRTYAGGNMQQFATNGSPEDQDAQTERVLQAVNAALLPTLVEIGRALDASSQANRALRDRLNQPINANINKYGRGGLIDEVATGLEKEKKSGRNDAVRRLFG